MRPRSSAFAVAMVLILVPSAAASAPVHPFEGAFESAGKVHTEGHVAAALGKNWTLAGQPEVASGVFLQAVRAELLVIEKRAPLIIASNLLLGPAPTAPSQGSVGSQTTLYGLSVQALEVRDGTAWPILGNAGANVTLGPTTCDIDQARPNPVQERATFRKRIFPDATRLVHAVCDGAPATTGGMTWMIWNTTLLLDHVEGGASKRMQLRTGPRTEQSSTPPGAMEKVERRAWLTVYGATGTWPFKSFDLVAPGLTVNGTLNPGEFKGQIVWAGVNEWGPWLDALPQGMFRLQPHGTGFQAAGRTWNGPLVEGASLGLPAAAGIVALGLLGVLGWVLYSRLSRSALLGHPQRQVLLELLRANPGANVKLMRAATGLSRSGVVNHLRRLIREGVVVMTRLGRENVFSLAEDRGRFKDPVFLAQLRRREEFLLLTLKEHPHLRQHELAERMGVTQSYVSRMLKTLVGRGLVEPTGRRRGYRVADRAGPDLSRPVTHAQGST